MEGTEKFLQNMKTYGVGHLLGELAELQAQIVEAVTETGKAGSFTLKIDFKMNGDKQITVIPTVSSKVPRKQIAAVSMFKGENGELHEENPAQMKFNTDKVVQLDQKKIINT